MALVTDIPVVPASRERSSVIHFLVRLFREKPLGAAGGLSTNLGQSLTINNRNLKTPYAQRWQFALQLQQALISPTRFYSTTQWR